MGHFKCEHSDRNKFRPKDHVLMGAKVGLAPNKKYQVGVSPKGGPNVPRTFPVSGCKTSFFSNSLKSALVSLQHPRNNCAFEY